jgi:hypothetical protein
LERLNSLLEDPRSLVLTEDTQRIFSDPAIIREATRSESRSIPICPGFSIAGTTTEAGFIGLSGPLKSRFTYIAAHPYRMRIPDSLPNSPQSDFAKIAAAIIGGNRDLVAAIKVIYESLQDLGRVNINVTEYVRWCRTALELTRRGGIDPQTAAGIACLRMIADGLGDVDRRRITKDVLAHHIPHVLSLNVVTEKKDPIVGCPIEPVSSPSPSPVRSPSQEVGALRTMLSRITVPVSRGASVNSVKSILDRVLWTQSAVDMADAVLTAIASGAMMIFEGSPGRGKTAVACAVLKALGVECTRVNLSPTTSAEDLFGREIPQSGKGGFTMRFVDGPWQRLCG